MPKIAKKVTRLPTAKPIAPEWAGRLRAHIRRHPKRKTKLSRNAIASHMKCSTAQVGHWMNGRRDIFLSEFFDFCTFVEADPAMILFGSSLVTKAQQEDIKKAYALLETFIPVGQIPTQTSK